MFVLATKQPIPSHFDVDLLKSRVFAGEQVCERFCMGAGNWDPGMTPGLSPDIYHVAILRKEECFGGAG